MFSFISKNHYSLKLKHSPTPPETMEKSAPSDVEDRNTTATFASVITTLSSSSNTTSSFDDVSKLSTSSGSETTNSSVPHHNYKSHATSCCDDPRWKAILSAIQSGASMFSLQDLNFIQKLGSGDIGTVYLVEFKGAKGCTFAAKVMDKEEIASRDIENRAKMERDILEMLDHPFLPTLYTTLDTTRWFCFLTEFCPGGDLHVLRQRQLDRRFGEAAVRFYASEVVVALEYLHMLGVIYRDLKPENVLVRSDGHIMLTDFDLCLKCDNSRTIAQLVAKDYPETINKTKNCPIDGSLLPKPSCIMPNCVAPVVSCFRPNRRRKGPSTRDIMAEPIDTRSMSFVGTHEYLAPEIVSGEGHGSAVDWWTLGIFIFELFYGVTPFKGFDHEFTLTNIVARALEFPKEPAVPSPAKDLITQLLIKNPCKRMGSTMGATAIKKHPFFDGVNWALLRCTTPPHTPRPSTYLDTISSCEYDASVEYY